jgi:hypothetical protein
LPKRLRAAVDDILAARGGLPLSPAEECELSVVYECGEWAERGVGSFQGCAAGMLGREVELGADGGLAVCSPTLGALILLELAAEWPAPRGIRDDEWPVLLRAWACVHGHDRRALARAAVSAEACGRTVLAWVMQTDATSHMDALRSALEEVWSGELYAHLAPPASAEEREWLPKARAWHLLALRLVRGCGGTVGHWLHAVPESQAFWMARALADADRAEVQAANPAAAPKQDDPRIVARAAWKAVEKQLTEKYEMRTRQVPVSGGRTVAVREMTFGEMRQVRDREKGAALPATWPVEVQFADRQAELDALPANDVFALAEAVYELTYGPAAAGAQQTGG